MADVNPALNTGRSRNQILDALLAKFQGIAAWGRQPSRKFKMWNDIPKGERPALFLVHDEEQRSQPAEGTPPYITMTVTIFIYTWSDPQSTDVPSVVIEDVLDAVDKALAPSPLIGRQTLDGLVSHCWIEGQTRVVPGDLEGDGLAVIPIKVLIPS